MTRTEFAKQHPLSEYRDVDAAAWAAQFARHFASASKVNATPTVAQASRMWLIRWEGMREEAYRIAVGAPSVAMERVLLGQAEKDGRAILADKLSNPLYAGLEY